MAAYEERFVAFVDALGFKELIARTTGPQGDVSVDEVRDLLVPPPPAGEEQIILGRIGDISLSGHYLTSFSDSIVISTHATEPGLIHLLTHLEKISFGLFNRGVLCRGAVTRGLIYHRDGLTFGPALIQAVEQERVARYPRIVLDQKVVKFGRSLAAPVGTVFGRLVRDCDDDVVMVHTLRRVRMTADAETEPPLQWRDWLQGRFAFLAAEFSRTTDNRDREKIEWFSNYLKWACDRTVWDVLKRPLPLPPVADLFRRRSD